VFEVGDHFRHDGFGNGKILCRLRQASRLHDRKQDVKVAQFDSATDAL
jgi:hypothetical protein